MTALAGELRRILQEESRYPPLSVEALANILRVLGFSSAPVPAAEIEAALESLIAGGQAERVWNRGATRYRVPRSAPAAQEQAS
jgi:hypothetical protein